MPFGKYKGIEMVCLPPSYVFWLLRQEWIDDWPAVAAYLREHKDEFLRAADIERAWHKMGVLKYCYE